MSSAFPRMMSALAVIALLQVLPICSFAEETPPAEAKKPSSTEPTVVKTYSISVLDSVELSTAQNLLCGAQCQGFFVKKGVWMLRAPEPIHTQFAVFLAEHDAPPPTIRLQLHLLKEIPGSRAGDTSPKLTLPENASRALKDLEQVMPGRHFELVDSAELRTTSDGYATLAHHIVKVEIKQASGSKKKFFVEKFELMENRGGLVLSTNFGIDSGETVVVGTAREGQESIVVLLTAAP